jgi:hypothetical protein
MLTHKAMVRILQDRYHLPAAETQELVRSMRDDLSLARTIEDKQVLVANYRDETVFIKYLDKLENDGEVKL